MTHLGWTVISEEAVVKDGHEVCFYETSHRALEVARNLARSSNKAYYVYQIRPSHYVGKPVVTVEEIK